MSFLPLREALRPDNVQDLIMPTDFAKLVSGSAGAIHVISHVLSGLDHVGEAGTRHGR